MVVIDNDSHLCLHKRSQRLGKLLMQKKKITKRIKSLVAIALTVAILIAFGLLSFVGSLVIVASIGVAALAFVLNGVIEAEVYRQNLVKGLDRLFSPWNESRKHLLIELAHVLLTARAATGKLTPAMKQYLEIKKYLESVKGRRLTAAERKEKKRYKRTFKYLQAELLEAIDSSDGKSCVLDDACLKTLRFAQKDIDQRIFFARLLTPLYIVAGITFGVVMTSTLNTALIATAAALGIAFPPLLFPILAITLATLAGISYSILMYQVMSKMIHSAIWSKLSLSLKNLFERQPNESNNRYRLRFAGLILLTTVLGALSVAATLATAGTWWGAIYLIVRGAPYIGRCVTAVTSALIAVTFVTNFSFTVKNTVKSLTKITDAVKHLAAVSGDEIQKYLFNDIKEAYQKEHWFQFINPFRLLVKTIEFFYTLAVMSGHIMSMALASDQVRVGKVNLDIPAAAVNAVTEIQEDLPYITGSVKDKPGQKHVHSKIPGYLLATLLSPLKLLSASWDYLGRGFNKHLNPSEQTFTAAFQKAFNIANEQLSHSKMDALPVIDAKWEQKALEAKYDKKIKRLSTAWVNSHVAREKCKVYEALKDQALDGLEPTIDADIRPTSRQSRFFSRKQDVRLLEKVAFMDEDFQNKPHF